MPSILYVVRSVVAILTMSSGGLLHAQSALSMCQSYSKQMNRSLPGKIDFLTVLESTGCTSDNGIVYFQFYHVISDPASLPRDVSTKSKAAAKRSYCKNEEFRNSLLFFSFDFYYYDKSNRPLYSFSIGKSDC